MAHLSGTAAAEGPWGGHREQKPATGWNYYKSGPNCSILATGRLSRETPQPGEAEPVPGVRRGCPFPTNPRFLLTFTPRDAVPRGPAVSIHAPQHKG